MRDCPSLEKLSNIPEIYVKMLSTFYSDMDIRAFQKSWKLENVIGRDAEPEPEPEPSKTGQLRLRKEIQLWQKTTEY